MSNDTKIILNAIARMQEDQATFQEIVMKRFGTLENEIRKNNLIIENDIKPTIQAMSEQLNHHSKILEQHTEQLNSIESKIENHDIKISVLDRTKSNRRKQKEA